MEPTRLYFQIDKNNFSRFLWFQNNKINEMLLGIYGQQKKQPILTLEFPERILNKRELESIRFNYSEAIKVNQQLDHITCHKDGRFHLKTTNDNNDRYVHKLQSNEPLGPNIPVFLDFIIISDVISNYKLLTNKPKNPFVSIGVKYNHFLVIRGMFSGINFNLEDTMGKTLSLLYKDHHYIQQAIILTSNSLQGCFVWNSNVLNKNAKKNRPPGTIISFKFPISESKHLIKTFTFE